MICKCGKEFDCDHKYFNLGSDIYLNHCPKCGKGMDGDMCEGKCPACFKEVEDKLLDEFKLYAENCLE